MSLGSEMGSTFNSTLPGQIASLPSNLIDFGMKQLSSALNAKRNWKYQKKAMELQNQYNIDAAKRSFDYQIQAWNMENEYNTPAAQMSRFSDAGLNPNLIYGNSNTGGSLSGATVNGSSLPHVDSKGDSTFSLLDGLRAIQQIVLQKKQIDSIDRDIKYRDTQTKEIEQRILESIERANGYKAKTMRNWFDLGLAMDIRDDTIKAASNRARMFGAQANYYGVNYRLRNKELEDYSNYGIRPTDNLLTRLIGMFLNRSGVTGFINNLLQ